MMTQAIIPSVLIVDATLASVEALQTILREAGFQVTKSVSGSGRALAEIRQNRPDIVCAELVNLDLVEMDLLVAIHRDFPEIPLVVISGNVDKEQVKQVIALGASGFILIPFAATEVEATFQRVRSHLLSRPVTPGDATR